MINKGEMAERTYLSDDLVVFKDSPGDVDAVVIPVCTRHVLVDIGVDASHFGR